MRIAQKEALNNEIKGYLFEYLTARELSALMGCEESFLCDKANGRWERLREYEMWLRHNDPVLMERLPVLAGKTARSFNAKISPCADRVLLCGRKEAGPGHPWGEADIRLEGGEPISIGLKLCKAEAFVNTKSGGLRSFLIKYFGDDASHAQERLNRVLDWSFDCMAGRLYESAGLEYEGGWDHSWEDAGHTLLPGELPAERSAFVLEHYARVVDVLYEEIKNYLERCASGPVSALPPLLGFKNKNLIQVFCFYKGAYEMDDIVVVDGRQVEWEALDVRLGERIPGRSSFEIIVKDQILQIRVKPMNKFNARSLKVNCSVKWRTAV